MTESDNTFGQLFKRFRLRSGFATIHDFADTLAEKGYVFEESLFSHWQQNTRVPKDRQLLLTISKIFIEYKGVVSLMDINILLESVGQGFLTEKELNQLTQCSKIITKSIAPKKVLTFLISTYKSKKVVRTGWKREGIKEPESVAEHSFLLSVMAMVFADQFGADKEKLIKMAVIHGLGEVITGDIVWSRGKIMGIEKRSKKESLEVLGISKIFRTINKTNEYKNIFEEMTERKSLEARIFWQFDKLEMVIQALEYEKEYGKKLDEFYLNAELQISSPYLKKIFKEIVRQRPR